MRIATNTAISHTRKVNRQRGLFSLFSAESATRQYEITPQSQLMDNEAQRQLVAAMAKLPWRFRVPLILREIEGMSYENISTVLHCSQGTVKSRISRGRGRLKKTLTPYLNGVN